MKVTLEKKKAQKRLKDIRKQFDAKHIEAFDHIIESINDFSNSYAEMIFLIIQSFYNEIKNHRPTIDIEKQEFFANIFIQTEIYNKFLTKIEHCDSENSELDIEQLLFTNLLKNDEKFNEYCSEKLKLDESDGMFDKKLDTVKHFFESTLNLFNGINKGLLIFLNFLRKGKYEKMYHVIENFCEIDVPKVIS